MTSEYVLSLTAEQDIDEIITYIALENPDAAKKFLDALFETMSRLAEFPDKPIKTRGCFIVFLAIYYFKNQASLTKLAFLFIFPIIKEYQLYIN